MSQADLEESIDITSVGYLKKNQIMSEQEKWITCYHEIGHALVGALQTHSAPVQKITVLPRTSGVLGFAQQLETTEPVMYSRTQLENRIVTVCAKPGPPRRSTSTRSTPAPPTTSRRPPGWPAPLWPATA